MRLVLSLIALSALPAAAQDLSNSTGVLTHFANRCAQIGADPSAAQAAAPGSSTVTASDGSMVIHYEATGQFGNLVFRRLSFPSGTNTDCSLLLNGFTPGTYDDMGTLIAQNGAALFGTEVAVYGDPTPQGAVQMIATPGYPPAALLTHAQGPDYVELALSLRTAPQVPQQEPEPEPAPVTPQPQVLDVTPAPAPPAPIVPTAAQQATMDTIGLGLTACLIVADDPTAWSRSLQEVGFTFQSMAGSGDIMLAKDGVTARLSADKSSGFCTLIAEDLPLEFGTIAGQDTAAIAAAGTATPITHNGCEAVSMTAPAAPVTMTFLNPGFQTACDRPLGSAISLELQ